MSIIEAIILGIIQGLTEFLPVSSSGHLELAKVIFGSEIAGKESMLFTIALHAATALSTVVVFRRDIAQIFKDLFAFKWNESTRFSWYILISMIPVFIIGMAFKDEVESLFEGNVVLVGSSLLFTAFFVKGDLVAPLVELDPPLLLDRLIDTSQHLSAGPGCREEPEFPQLQTLPDHLFLPRTNPDREIPVDRPLRVEATDPMPSACPQREAFFAIGPAEPHAPIEQTAARPDEDPDGAHLWPGRSAWCGSRDHGTPGLIDRCRSGPFFQWKSRAPHHLSAPGGLLCPLAISWRAALLSVHRGRHSLTHAARRRHLWFCLSQSLTTCLATDRHGVWASLNEEGKPPHQDHPQQ